MSKFVVTALVAVAVWTGAPLAAQDNPSQGQVFLTPFIGYYSPSSEVDLKDKVGGGFGIGYAFTDRIAAELSYARFDQGAADADLTWASFLWSFRPGEVFKPYALFGAGRASVDFDGGGNDNANQGFLGIGTFAQVSERFSVRGDLRGVATDGRNHIEPFAMLGATLFLGAAQPKVLPDSDGDGVPDPSDQCPGTPFGRAVDASGCELDSDGDGVVDNDDACPNTPAGATVDRRGCALDSDGDGVPDYRDQCPDSELGARVDDKGCYIELEETVTIDMNLQFDSNSAALRPQHLAEIQEVVDFLRLYPTANAVIEGHTDSSGAAGYNQTLSERRATSVRNYLVEQAGVDADRLTVAGYGESRPIASNETRVGMQTNRRVSAVISGTRTVRQR